MRRSTLAILVIVASWCPAIAGNGDATRGRQDFRACASCHSLDRALDGWLTDPQAMVRDNDMPFTLLIDEIQKIAVALIPERRVDQLSASCDAKDCSLMRMNYCWMQVAIDWLFRILIFGSRINSHRGHSP